MTVNMIVAVADNLAIGRGGDQPFYISGDLRRFKALTMGHSVIMGRKTFEALPRGPLPGRANIVITRDGAYSRDGITVVHGVSEALEAARQADGADDVFVIGGGHVYRDMIDMADVLHLTRIYAAVDDADTFFPAIVAGEWEETEVTPVAADPASGVTYNHITMRRRR